MGYQRVLGSCVSPWGRPMSMEPSAVILLLPFTIRMHLDRSLVGSGLDDRHSIRDAWVL